MSISIKSIAGCGCLGAVILAIAACGPRRSAPMSVSDLMEDRLALYGVLMKCNQDPSRARTDSNCLNARIAIERLARQSEPAEEAKRREEFERNREKLRLAQEEQMQEQEAKARMDAYDLPLVPVEPTPAPAPQLSDANPPSIARESNP